MTARTDAAGRGEKRYQGPPCTRCQGTARYTSSGTCVACSDRKSGEHLRALRAALKAGRGAG
jgi:hypothetical protein